MELKDYLRILKRRWLTILIVGGAFYALSYFYMQRQPTVFAASVEVALKESPYPTFGGEFPGLFQDYYTRATKIAMIRSRKVLELAVTKYLTPYYGDIPPSAETAADAGDGKPSQQGEERERKITAAVNAINAGLQVTQNKETEIIAIAFSDLNAQKALDIVNAVARAYEERASQAAGEGIDNAVILIDKITATRDQEIGEAQRKLKEIPQSATITPLEIEIKQIVDRMQRLAEEKDRKSTERALAEDQAKHLTALLSEGTVPPEITPAVGRRSDNIRAEIAERERALDRLLEKYTDKAQQVIEARKEIERLREDAIRETERETRLRALAGKLQAYDLCSALKARERELALQTKKLEDEIAAAREEYNRKLAQPRGDENRQQQQYAWEKMILDGQMEYLKNSKLNLARQKENLLINRRLVENPVERISWARDASPKARAGTTSYSFLAITALIIGVACAYMLEYMNTTVRTEHDVRRYVNLPTIGAIARIREIDQRLLINLATKSPLFEVFNTIGTILETYAAENNAKIFMVASSKAEEGKSTVSTNIAVSLARTGENVILIDCDLRKAIVHKFFNIDNSKGVSTYVLNQMGESAHEEVPRLPEQLTLDEIIKPTEIEGLKIIPAGPHPKNPVALLKSAAFRKMLDDVRSRADIVLLDVPPVNIAVDTMILAPIIDATMLLISAGETNKDEVTFAKRMLESAKGRIIGCILNKITIESRGYYYYYYYDNYRYYRES